MFFLSLSICDDHIMYWQFLLRVFNTRFNFDQVDPNRPFPSSGLPHLQSESKCEVFVMMINFHSYVK